MVTPIFSEEPDFIKNQKSPDFEFRDEAIPLIQFQPQHNSFDVNPEAIEFLKRLDSPICVIGVAGMYRTGKSYLLNRILLDRKDGFGVGATVNACTKGL
mmetsp:Transcript_35188/g.6326  ORF Transcript_35188/g.6326 Transcript_35188/m.6326 type:complete len:99 (+) Transcript_35188:17-313(+)